MPGMLQAFPGQLPGALGQQELGEGREGTVPGWEVTSTP